MDLFLALSVHRFVTSVGSYAGFAAIVGLAILILLFFAQARETNALRDHVDELLDRIAGLESRLSRQAQAAVPEEPAQVAANAGAGRPALAAVSGGRATTALPPSPPAGVGAPALSAATRVIPLGAPAAAVAARAAADGDGGGVATAPAPATPAAANGSSRNPVALPNGPGPSGGRPPGPSSRQPAPVAARSTASAATAAGAARRPPARPTPGGRDGAPSPRPRRVSRGVVALILGLLVAVGAIAAAIVLVSSSSSKSPTTAASHPATRRASAATTRINPRTVTVAVLNGTATPGLAHRIAQRLGTDGFQTAKPTTASDQTRTSTTVAYIPGARNQALAVAKTLKVSSGSVAPVDQGTRAVACQGLATCPASVFVTVGSDLANQ
jgi:hypothetical protein